MATLGTLGVWDVTNFMLTPPTRRASTVRNLKKRTYNYKTDYYKRWREAVVAVAKGERKIDSLRQVSEAASELKRTNFHSLTEHFQSFLFVAAGDIVDADRFSKNIKGLDIRVTPEFTLCVPGEAYPVKLWLNKQPPTQTNVETFLAIAHDLYQRHGLDDALPALLDVPRQNLHLFQGKNDMFDSILEYEMSSLAALWAAVEH